MPSYLKEDPENQIWEYRYQKGPAISDKELCPQEKISEFLELLLLEIPLDKQMWGTIDSTSRAVFYQLFQLVDQLALCNNTSQYITKRADTTSKTNWLKGIIIPERNKKVELGPIRISIV